MSRGDIRQKLGLISPTTSSLCYPSDGAACEDVVICIVWVVDERRSVHAVNK